MFFVTICAIDTSNILQNQGNCKVKCKKICTKREYKIQQKYKIAQNLEHTLEGKVCFVRKRAESRQGASELTTVFISRGDAAADVPLCFILLHNFFYFQV